MVGGTVIETLVGTDRVWINCRDKHGSECAIFVERTDESRAISEGDSIWWQGVHAYWTPKGKPFHDRPLRRRGASGVTKPTVETR